MKESNDNKKPTDMGKGGKGPSRTADFAVWGRVRESMMPEDERICYDPLAIRFISREMLDFITNHPDEDRAMVEQRERLVPGCHSSALARVRYFDDVVRSSIGDGLEQLVILGAGYDSRAYRIEGLKNVRVFEVDHPSTQRLKMDKVKEIFSMLPGHVVFIPVDLAVDDLGRRLIENGYDRLKKTLFTLEGVINYLSPDAVDSVLSFIAHNSGKGNAIVFDYILQSVVDGTCEHEAGKNLRKMPMNTGEPFLFGIKDGELKTFLAQRGFTEIRNINSEDYKKMYFHGKNEGRVVNRMHSFVYAVVE